MISIKNLKFKYKNSPTIINDLSFDLSSGESLIILGRNGIGKTTLLKCLTKEITNYEGIITINDINIRNLTISDLSNVLTLVSANSICYQNLCVADYLITGFTNQLIGSNVPDKEMYRKAFSTIDDMNQGCLFNRNVFELSSGELQIVKIARAILQNPQIVIFDEPTSNLDVKNQMMVLKQIAMLSDKGYTVITTSHNPGHAFELNSKVLLINETKYLYGSAREVLTADNLKETYLLNAKLNCFENRTFSVFEDSDTSHKLFY